jgi:hypothetical protein
MNKISRTYIVVMLLLVVSVATAQELQPTPKPNQASETAIPTGVPEVAQPSASETGIEKSQAKSANPLTKEQQDQLKARKR